jgi:hypothetical protein
LSFTTERYRLPGATNRNLSTMNHQKTEST